MRFNCSVCKKTKADDLFPLEDTTVCFACIKKEKEKDKKHFVYKTTNKINGQFYIGKHSTFNIDDGYLGSGGVIKAAIMLYGHENFTFEILDYTDTDWEAFELEEKYVTEDVINNSKCLNQKTGGHHLKESVRCKKNKYHVLIEQYLLDREAHG